MPRGRPRKIKPIEKVNGVHPEFKVTFLYPKETVTHEVYTIEEGLEKLDMSKAISGKCLIRLETGGRKSEIFIYPANCKRIVVNKVYRGILAKRLITLLK